MGQICLYGAIQSNAIQSIVISSQLLDHFSSNVFGKTCGLALSGVDVWKCVGGSFKSASPFGDTYMFFTIGFLVVLVCTLPFGLMNLDDNIGVQVFAFVAGALIFFQWVLASIVYKANGFTPSGSVPAAPSSIDGIKNLPGTVMLSLAYCFVGKNA